ncbi:hypothetical protein HBB16_03330 [Pseudonocardia sp. MCCB 268]|nr:hypothetical protein [Pseudonocardia cytotoxica]
MKRTRMLVAAALAAALARWPVAARRRARRGDPATSRPSRRTSGGRLADLHDR